jgi:DNA polymerase-3 subunit gamma/tau
VTVLSRCLQFSLKRLNPEQIETQCRKILAAEKIVFEEDALALLARAADGSMRDGLSLLDQAIAYGGGKLTVAEVRAMLGTIDQDSIERLLQALAGNDAAGLLAVAHSAAELNIDPSVVLEELLLALHRIALAQTDAALVTGPDSARLLAHARQLTPEDVQLYYQIALLGRRDLGLAPDPRTGLEMTLLRMLVFRPAGAETVQTGSQKQTAVAAPAPSVVSARPVPAKPVDTNSSWAEVVPQLKLTGVARELASNTTLESRTGDTFNLILNEAHAQLLNREREAALRQALEDYHGRPVKLSIRAGAPQGETPAQEKRRQQDERQQAAVAAIENDPHVAALKSQFNARVNPGSIRPKT